MENNFLGDLKIQMHIVRIAPTTDPTDLILRTRGKSILLQSITCYYMDREQIFERFMEANPNLKKSNVWAEFVFRELCFENT